MSRGKLPIKPSELLKVALRDLEATENDARYLIDMRHWHTPVGRACLVCLAGSVMAQSLKAPIDVYIQPCNFADFEESDVLRLTALDHFQRGDIDEALLLLGCYEKVYGVIPACLTVTPYEKNRAAWKQDMRQIIDYLEWFDL